MYKPFRLLLTAFLIALLTACGGDGSNSPSIGVESNGEQIFITDAGFHRLLIWDSWPTENQQAADIVLGQANMTLKTPMNTDGDDDTLDSWPSASTLWEPAGVSIHEDKLLVTDGAIGRVLIFESR